jgi:transposase
MDHVAIDLGGMQSQVCVRASDGTIVEEVRIPTHQLGLYLTRRPPSRVIVETCTEAFHVADLALELKHDVRVVPSMLVHSLGVGARGLKTDRRDAQTLSQVSCRVDLPSVHIPSMRSREYKSLLSMRDSLVSSRTKMINTVRAWLRARSLRVRSSSSHCFHVRVLALGIELPPAVRLQAETLKMISAQIRRADAEVERLAKAEPVCQRLRTIPGIGPVTSLRFVATLDKIERFHQPHHVASYLGLSPGEWSSSDKQRRMGITKAGSSQMRCLLIQAAWAAWRREKERPLGLWADRIAQRRGKFVAVVAVARKLAGIAFAVWRDGTTFESTRAARP